MEVFKEIGQVDFHKTVADSLIKTGNQVIPIFFLNKIKQSHINFSGLYKEACYVHWTYNFQECFSMFGKKLNFTSEGSAWILSI